MPLEYIPSDASTTLRGLVNLTTQSFAGAKTFTGVLAASGGITSNGFAVATSGKVTFVASSTGAASANIPSGTAPTSPSSGDMWYDGTNLFFRNGGSSVNLAGGGTVTTSGTPASGQVAYFTGASVLTGASGFTYSAGVLTVASLVLGSSSGAIYAASGTVSVGTLSVGNGGTGATTLTGILQGNGASAITAVTDASAQYQVFVATGAGAYQWGTVNLASTQAVTGTLPVGNGGTGIASYSTGSLVYASGSTTLSQLAIGSTNGAILISNGSSAPSWATTLPATYTFSGVLTMNAKATFAAPATGFASVNFPSGTAPTTPTSGDFWWDGTHLYFYNGSSSVNLLATSGITGSGTSSQVAYFNGGTSLTSSANFTFSGSALAVAGSLTVTTAKTTLAAATTGYASLNLPSGTAPTSPASGDTWWDGTHLYFYNGSSNVNLLGFGTGTVTGTGTSGQLAIWSATTVLTGSSAFTVSGTAITFSGAGGFTVTNAKSTFAAATTSYAAINLPSGVAPTSPVTGDIWSTGTAVLFYNGTANKTIAFTDFSNISGTLTVPNGGTGATTLTGILQGNGTSAVTAITNSSTVGQGLYVTGTSTYAWGALNLGTTAAITGTLPVGNGGTGQASFASTNSLVVSGSSSTGAFTTVTGAAGLLYGTAANTAPTFATSIGAAITFTAGLTVTTSGITDTVNALATTSTVGFTLQNTTASTSGATQQQSPGFDYIAHAWNTTVTAADNFVRLREELQVTSGTTPTGTFVWKTSVDTGTASFTNRMTLTTGGLLTVSNGLTITAGTFTIGSNTLALSSNSTLSTNSQSLILAASTGNVTLAAGSGSSATQHNLVQSGTTQYVLESATAPAALGDMYYASTTSYATMSKLSIGSRGAVMVVSTATPTPTWLSPSATSGVALISNGTGADLTFGTVVVAGGGTGQTSFASTNSLIVSGSSSTAAFATVTGASGLLYGTAANTAPTFTTSIGVAITFTAGITVTTSGIVDTINALTNTSTQGFALQNTTASTSGSTIQQSPGFDYIGHVWNTTATAADNFARFREELQVTSANAPIGTLVWKASIDTGAASFTNVMTLNSLGVLNLSMTALTTTSTQGFALQNTTASTSGTTQQQSPGFDYIGHAWNTTATAADNFVRLREELQVTSGSTPTGTFVWKTSVDTGTAAFTNRMTLTTGGLLTVSNGLTITTGTFTIGSNTFALSSNSTLSTNSQSLIVAASTGNVTFAAGSGSSATQHNLVQSGTTQYVLESATAPTALGDMYYASTTSYATMTKLAIGARGAMMVASGSTPTPTWLTPSSTAGVAMVSAGTGADLAYGTVVVAGGGTGQTSFASTNSLIVSGSSSTAAFATVTGATGLLYGTAANTAPTFATSIGTTITFSNGLTLSGGTFTLNTLESSTYTATTTAPSSGHADTDTWQPSGTTTGDFYAYYQQITYNSNQSSSSFGMAAFRADAITSSTLSSATLLRADSYWAHYNPSHTGTVSQVTGLRVTQVATLTGTTTAYNGVRIENDVTSGTVTNSAGIYIDTIGAKGATTGASIYLVSDGTSKTGLSWGTSTSAYTADVGLYRSGSGAITITGAATVSGKVTFAASTTGAASANIPSGTAPTSPSAGDTWYDGTYLYFKDNVSGYTKRLNKRMCVIAIVTSFTPTSGADTAEIPIPWHSDGSSSITWNVRRIDFRVQTAGGAPQVTVEKSTASTAFSAVTIGSVTLGSGAFEGNAVSGFTNSTVASGDKVRINVNTVATALNWTVTLTLEES